MSLRYINSLPEDLQNELVVQNDKLEQLKSPKFFRTPAEREEQLRKQLKRTQYLKELIEKCDSS